MVGSSLAAVLVLAGAALIYYGQTRAGAILIAAATICLAFAFGRLKRCGCRDSGSYLAVL